MDYKLKLCQKVQIKLKTYLYGQLTTINGKCLPTIISQTT